MAIKTIVVKGDPVRIELLADAAITPGALCERTTTGAKVHATASGNAERLFAIEDELQGGEIGTDYTTDNRCQLGIFNPGDVAYALITGTPAVGTFLESAGDGTLKEHVPDSTGVYYPQQIVGVAIAAAAGGFIQCEIM